MRNWLLAFRGGSKSTRPRHQPYSIWSTAFDEVRLASDLLSDADTLHEARLAPQTARAASATHAQRVASEIEAKAKLLQADPIRPVSILIDMSGSMRRGGNRSALPVVEGTERLCDCLVWPVEILGFTTVEWHGEPVRSQWKAAGRPSLPGRLCALRHVVFREFPDDTPADLTALFAEPLLTENLDGEAVLWAVSRLKAAPATGAPLLIVVSDGAPVDDSTLSCNSGHFLSDHIRLVTSQLTAAGDVELFGVGLGYDVSAFYPSCVKIDAPEDTADALARIARCLDGSPQV